MYIITISDSYAINADQIQFVSYVLQPDKELSGDAGAGGPPLPTIRIKFAGEKDELLLSGEDASRLWQRLRAGEQNLV